MTYDFVIYTILYTIYYILCIIYKQFYKKEKNSGIYLGEKQHYI